MRHQGVDKLSFTRIPEVGREIAVEAAADFRPVTLELGGKSPQIVLGGADPAAVVLDLAMGFFANQGEICAAGTRVLVARERYEAIAIANGTRYGLVRSWSPCGYPI